MKGKQLSWSRNKAEDVNLISRLSKDNRREAENVKTDITSTKKEEGVH